METSSLSRAGVVAHLGRRRRRQACRSNPSISGRSEAPRLEEQCRWAERPGATCSREERGRRGAEDVVIFRSIIMFGGVGFSHRWDERDGEVERNYYVLGVSRGGRLRRASVLGLYFYCIFF